MPSSVLSERHDMKCLFIIRSERCLTKTLQLIADGTNEDQQGCSLLVLSKDDSLLGKLVRTRIAEYSIDSINVDFLDDAVTDITLLTKEIGDLAKGNGLSLIAFFYKEGDLRFEKSLFELSRYPTLWIKQGTEFESASSSVIPLMNPPSLLVSRFFDWINRECKDPISFEDEGTAIEQLQNLFEGKGSQIIQQKNRTMLLDLSSLDLRSDFYEFGRGLLQDVSYPTVVLGKSGDSTAKTIASKVQRAANHIAPAMGREQRITLAKDLMLGSEPNLEFIGLMAAAAMMASFGLLQDSASVIIGAMLIAPLMTPILGAGLALTQGNQPLFRSALFTILLGFISALISSMAFGLLFLCFRQPTITDEMWARCAPSPLDFCVGLIGGLAASYARTRSHLSSALAGAAIAAALVPPISTAGLQIVFMNWTVTSKGTPVVGPLLLVSINVLTIMFGAAFILWVRGMRPVVNSGTLKAWVLVSLSGLGLLVLLILIWMV